MAVQQLDDSQLILDTQHHSLVLDLLYHSSERYGKQLEIHNANSTYARNN
jgi:hypothetical protein